MDVQLAAALEETLGLRLTSASPVAGGSISEAYRVRAADGNVFVKVAPAANADWFRAEAEGLAALAQCRALRVPIRMTKILPLVMAVYNRFLCSRT